MLAYSSVAQAGYMLAGVVVSTRLGVQATVFYVAVYVVMNLAAFAVIVARERETGLEDDITSMYGLGADRPLLAWPMTIAMLALAGFPATVGFIGKFYLIDATVDGDYAWLGIAIVIGSMISLRYYLRVVGTMWMDTVEVDIPAGPGASRRVRPIAGWSPEADASAQWEVTFVAVICAAATVVLGVVPGPLFDVARDVGTSLSQLL
jgi:NADH-quinone oxidoreductase subunit N